MTTTLPLDYRIDGNVLSLSIGRCHSDLFRETVEFIKTSPNGYRFDQESGTWKIKINSKVIDWYSQGVGESSILMYHSSESHDEKYSDFFSSLPFRLFVHQKETVIRAVNQKSFLFDHKPGLGKTITAVTVLKYRMENDGIKSCLVVCPKSGFLTWEKTFKKFGIPAINIATSRERKRAIKNNVCIINYDLLSNLKKELLDRGFEFFIFDESHRVKNPGTQFFRMSQALSRNARHVLLLTGTLYGNSIFDIYSQVSLLFQINPLGFNDTVFRCKYFHCDTLKPDAIDSIKKILSKFSTSYLLSDCTDMPAVQDRAIYVEMDPIQEALYGKKRNEIFTAGITSQIQNNQVLALQQITSGFLYRTDGTAQNICQGENPKIGALSDLVDQLGKEKFLIWYQFREEGRLIRELIESKGISFIHLSGETNKNKEMECWKESQVAICQIQSACESLNMQAASYAIYFSQNFSLIQNYQSRARIYRIGQKRPVIYYFLIGKRKAGITIDEAINEVLRRRYGASKEISGADFDPLDFQKVIEKIKK